MLKIIKAEEPSYPMLEGDGYPKELWGNILDMGDSGLWPAFFSEDGQNYYTFSGDLLKPIKDLVEAHELLRDRKKRADQDFLDKVAEVAKLKNEVALKVARHNKDFRTQNDEIVRLQGEKEDLEARVDQLEKMELKDVEAPGPTNQDIEKLKDASPFRQLDPHRPATQDVVDARALCILAQEFSVQDIIKLRTNGLI